jgi:DNA-binding CsgD family transcriptional regulator
MNPGTKSNAGASSAPFDTVRAQDVMRQIVGLVAAANPTGLARRTDDDTEGILLDTNVDGDRYLLVRMPNPTRQRPALSPRELEIVRMVAQGHPNKTIAALLDISSWTVCTHLRRIFAKLSVGSRAAMVAKLLDAEGLSGAALVGQPPLDRPGSSSQAARRVAIPQPRGVAAAKPPASPALPPQDRGSRMTGSVQPNGKPSPGMITNSPTPDSRRGTSSTSSASTARSSRGCQ